MSESNSESSNERLIYTRSTPKENKAKTKSDTSISAAQIKLPIFTAIALGVGLIFGARFFGSQDNSFTTSLIGLQTEESASDQAKKMRQVLSYIEDYYVDTVNLTDITDHGIKEMLSKLDPHTSYIPAKDVEIMNSQLEGDFEGIGVEFVLFEDTIQVIMPIPNSPSSRAGIEAGDRIIKVDDTPVANVKIDNRKVFDLLRGKKNSKVNLTVFRPYQNKELVLTVERGTIPTHTVEVGYMLTPKTGYIKVSRFGMNTFKEFETQLNKLLREGMKDLVLDLRGNPGGYMDQAVRMVDELLAGTEMIVYTDGKKDRFDSEEKAHRKGNFEENAVIVLLDEGSASASEIVAGALQDNDRALIVGRRSFGKGLVQKPITLRDGSELRLTISRYYTPSGRSIQKPYSDTTDYSLEIMERYTNGELYQADSSKMNTEKKYKTLHGRTVYGSGGIMPDIFVSRDTSYFTPYVDSLYSKSVVRNWTSTYYNLNKEKFKAMKVDEFISNFTIDKKLENDFLNFAKNQKVIFNDAQYQISRSFILNQIKASLAKLNWQYEGYYPVLNQEDKEIKVALENLKKAEELKKYYLIKE
ncbi:S41 family peptidase [Bernardetia sp. Wsw4-3y2]|uniref:S41 family peptidase n=1 Tax=Bernardetia sp. Wsw4-3y2 TaxID=3127471 RepID=UPI0030D485B1